MNKSEGTLNILVRLPPDQPGQVLLAIFNSADDWMDMDKMYRSLYTAAPLAGVTVFEVKNLPFGIYACCALVDRNSNNRMDFNIAGYPLEDFAFSNQAIGNFGPPTFEAASFVHSADTASNLEIIVE